MLRFRILGILDLMGINKQQRKIIRELGVRVITKLTQSRAAREIGKFMLLVVWWRGKKVMLQFGRHRNPEVFPKGYVGETIRLPKMYLLSGDPIFELFEYIDGELLSDRWKNIAPPIPSRLLREVVKIYQLFRLIAEASHFSPIQISPIAWFYWLQKFHERGERVVKKGLMTKRQFLTIKTTYLSHLEGRQPQWCLGNFTLTNFVYHRKKIGVINLSRTSQYPYGYDVAYFVWSLLFHIPQEHYRPQFVERSIERILSSFARHECDDLSMRERMSRYRLAMMERYVGSLFDVAENVDHVQKIFQRQNKRKQEFSHLLHKLLNSLLMKMKM